MMCCAGEGDEGDSRAQRGARLTPLLWAGLSGAAYAPMPDGTTTLALAVDAASPETRILVQCRPYLIICHDVYLEPVQPHGKLGMNVARRTLLWLTLSIGIHWYVVLLLTFWPAFN